METLSEILSKDGSKKFGAALIECFEKFGFGTMSKSDFEAYMFHHLLLNIDATKNVTNFDLMKLLKITPSKLRSLEMTRSAKFLDLDLSNQDNWKLIFNSLEGKKLETEDKENGKVRIYIDDIHVHRLIERFIIEGGSSIDYTLNRNQLVIKYSEFLNLMDQILLRANQKPLISIINQDKSKFEIEKDFKNINSVFSDIKKTFKDKSYDKIAESVLTIIINLVRNQIGI
ncbi:hypothetical protein LJC30_04720 [Odoribacter sp. OttesenSCG-928-L07]|nr:hypothetical protein [Odoribacter sp. OttesenSCG-928-L07]